MADTLRRIMRISAGKPVSCLTTIRMMPGARQCLDRADAFPDGRDDNKRRKTRE